MFCSRCGNETDSQLRYCNRCGAKFNNLSGEVSRDSDSSKPLILLIVSLGTTTVVGLAALIGLLAVLFASTDDIFAIVVLALVYLATLIGIDWMILRQISRLIGLKERHESNQGRENESINLFSKTDLRQLDPAEFRPASVTDHTTRTLEEVFVKEKR